MHTFLLAAQIVISVLLVLTILSQEKGVAAGGTFGGTGQVFHGRRGADKLLLWVTVVLASMFVLISISFIFVDRTVIDLSGLPTIQPESSEGAPELPETEEHLPVRNIPEGVTITPLPIEE